MLSTMWVIIKALAGLIAIIFLSGSLILLVRGFIDAIFKNFKD